MIRPAQLKLLERAREAVATDPVVFAEALRRSGGADAVEALTTKGFNRLMDHLTVIGFRCRQRPILSAATRKLVEEAARQLGLTPHTYAADLRGFGGAADLRDLFGRGLIELLIRRRCCRRIAPSPKHSASLPRSSGKPSRLCGPLPNACAEEIRQD